jgi:hypothetical protein
MKRIKTEYPGVFYREAIRIGGKGMERVYYIVFKKDGKFGEEKWNSTMLSHDERINLGKNDLGALVNYLLAPL